MIGQCSMKENRKVCIYRNFNGDCALPKGCIFWAKPFMQINHDKVILSRFVDWLQPDDRIKLRRIIDEGVFDNG